jgi:hypothetical protein
MTTVPDATDASDVTGPTGADGTPAPLHLPLSPVGTDRMRGVTVGAVLGSAVVLAVASTGGFGSLLAATLVLSLVLAWSWPVLGGSYTPQSTAIVLLASAPAIVFTALRDDLRWTAAAVAFGVVLSFLAQLVRRTGREGLVLTLLASFGGLVPMASATLAIAAADEARGRAYLVVVMTAAAAAVLADLLVGVRKLTPFLGLVALLAAIAGGVVAALLLDEFGAWAAVGAAAAAGSLSWSFRRVLARQPAMLGTRGQLASGVGSVLVLGVIVRLFTLVS